MDDRKRFAYLLSLSTERYVVEHPRLLLRFIGIAALVGLLLVTPYLLD